MMDYREFSGVFAEAEKDVKDKVAAVTKLEKSIKKNEGKGDVRAVIKDAEQLQLVAEELLAKVIDLRSEIASFDYARYFTSGEFAIQLLQACEQKNIDVAGDFPVYEMFPYKIKVDAENQEVWIDRKKTVSMSPECISQTIRDGLDKLDKVKFDANSFINELYSAYCSYNLKHTAKSGAVVAIMNIYKEMVPMARFRKDYDQQAFAFDVARLYRNQDTLTKDGKRVVFSSARGTQIRILDENGMELFIGSIAFEDAE
jgi:hypothetical protein